MPLEKSLCNRCSAPGACCRRMTLSDSLGGSPYSRWWHESESEPAKRIAAINAELAGKGLPFRVLEEVESEAKEGTFFGYTFMCPQLLPSGRCGIYRKRPGICRDFKAGSGSLCVMYVDESKEKPKGED